MSAILFIMLGSLMTGGLSASFVRLFEVETICVAEGPYSGDSFGYRLFVPRNQKPQDKLPLIVWFHGYQERGNDLVHHLRWLDQLVITNATTPDRYRFYLLALQLPDTEVGWYQEYMKPNEKVSDMEVGVLAIVMQAVDDVCKRFPIDRERITACGVSFGGSACWELGVRYAERLAGIAPIASSGGSVDSMFKLKNVPTWAFNCTNDASSSMVEVKKRISAINAAGGSAYVTEVVSSEHDAWTAAFQDYDLLDWLLTQNRSRKSTSQLIKNVLRFGLSPQILLPVSLIALGVVVLWKTKPRIRGAK